MSANSFAATIDGIADPVEVPSFRGRERLSRPYHFDVELLVPAELELRSLLGRAMHLELRVGGRVRTIAGEIERVEFGRVLADGRHRPRARLVPRLRRLAIGRRSRVFQSMSTLEIASAVLGQHLVPLVSLVAGPMPTRIISMQHEETDLEYVSRLLAEEGLAFRFHPPPEGSPAATPDTVVLFEDASGYEDLPGGRRLAYRELEARSAGMVREEHHVAGFVARHRKAPKHVLHREFDLKNPERFAEDAFPPALLLGGESVHHHHGAYGEMQHTPQRALQSLDAHRRRSAEFAGRSECARLAPGLRFSLDDHDEASLSTDYAVTEVKHEGIAAEESTYKNDFLCVGEVFLQRPPLPARRVRQSLETATVTGPAGEEIYTDNLGRVQVRFHWDLDDSARPGTSCWLRVAQSWAGPGWGTQFIPRVGMEVLVGFLGGDPDRPLVIGALNNATHLPSFPLPEERARSGFKTQSTLGEAGYNELSFSDRAGGEEIRVVAERDYNAAIKHNETVTVGADAALVVAGSRSVTVNGAAETTIYGEARLRYEGGASTHVEGRSLHSVEGHAELDVRGDYQEQVDGSRKTVIDGDRVDEVRGPFTVRAESTYTLVVGAQDAPGHADFQFLGMFTMATDGVAQLESLEKLRLVCGKSVIELAPDGITLTAPTIKIKGSSAVAVEGDGPSINLEKEAQIVADKLTLFGKESSLELEKDATLLGKKIYLNCQAQKPEAEASEEKKKTKQLKLKMANELFEPYASKHYLVRALDQRIEGTTNDQGEIEADVPDETKLVELTLWIEDYPQGKKQSYTIKLDELPAIDTVAGVQVRLKNLGYYSGPTDGEELDPETRQAIATFQTDHDIPVTGINDDELKATLQKRHGS